VAAVEDAGFEVKVMSRGGMELSRLTVSGMTCGNCASTVERALGKVPGVSSASVSYATSLAEVWYSSASTGGPSEPGQGHGSLQATTCRLRRRPVAPCHGSVVLPGRPLAHPPPTRPAHPPSPARPPRLPQGGGEGGLWRQPGHGRALGAGRGRGGGAHLLVRRQAPARAGQARPGPAGWLALHPACCLPERRCCVLRAAGAERCVVWPQVGPVHQQPALHHPSLLRGHGARPPACPACPTCPACPRPLPAAPRPDAHTPPRRAPPRHTRRRCAP
jgi:hypothetical protein